ncbi:MAG: hypothetical protein ACXU9U_00105 [Parachlamydiaceae bacterium]
MRKLTFLLGISVALFSLGAQASIEAISFKEIKKDLKEKWEKLFGHHDSEEEHLQNAEEEVLADCKGCKPPKSRGRHV